MAARVLARDTSLSVADRRVALSALVQVVRQRHRNDPWLATQSQHVIYAEARELLVSDRTPQAPTQSWRADPVTNALWSLRGEHRRSCPTCLRLIPSAEALAALEDRDRAIWAELRHREDALEHEAEAAASA